MSIKQISVFLVNKPGTLKNMTGVLASHDVDLKALSLAETKEYGIARFVADDTFHALNVLRDADFVATVNSVVAVEVPDEPGALDNLLQVFADEEVNIEYMYSFVISGEEKSAGMIFRVIDAAAAEPKLRAKGLKLLTQDDIVQI